MARKIRGYTAELTAKAAGSIVFDSATYSVVSGALPTGLALANQAGNNGKATLSWYAHGGRNVYLHDPGRGQHR